MTSLRTTLLLSLAAGALCLPAAALAQAPGAPPAAAAIQPAPAFLQRADDMLAVYNGKQRMRPLFSEKAGAQAKVSLDDAAARVEQTFAKFRKKAGPALGVSHVVATTPYQGDVFVNFKKTQLRMRLSVEPDAPHGVRGFGISSNLSPAAEEG